MTGQSLGHYRVGELLGAGGMGEVYRARDEHLHRDVAIKVLSTATAADPAARPRLLREARAAAALNHPHICTVFEVAEAEGRAFIAMELVEGRPLDEVIGAGGLAADQVLRYGAQIADAVAHAHARGIVHRDLKPANVRSTADGRAKVLDFGLARRLDSNVLADVTTHSLSREAPGTIAGTLPYMAPEQFRGLPADARSDVWALGVLLYEMAAGRRPFEGRTGFELSSAVLSAPPPPLPVTVPPALQTVIARCLAKVPDQRYRDAGEVQAALEAVHTGRARPAADGRPLLTRRRWLAAAGAGLAAAGVLAAFDIGGVRDWLGGGGAPPRPIKLAVLPFENLTGDPAQEYFSDGLTEEMIGQLGRLEPARLSVIARTSAMRYKDAALAIDEIGRELGVDYILEGSARREGNRVRVSAQLVQVSDQVQVWARSYERELASMLAVQHEVARGVAASLALTLLPAQQRGLDVRRQVDPAAYEAYLKGRFHWYRFTPEDFALARKYFEEAVRIDPNYALAYVGLADAISTPGHRGQVPASDVFPEARALVAKALELDDTLAEAHDLEARMKFAYDWDWSGAEAGFQRAIDLNPNHPDAHVVYAQVLRITGRADAALAEVQRGLERDPHNAFFQQQLAFQLASSGRRQEAIRRLETLLAAQPGYPPAHGLLSGILYREGRHDESLNHMAPFFRGDRELVEVVTRAYADDGYRTAMRRAAETLVERSAQRYVSPVTIARAYVRAGDPTLALDWLEKAIDVRDTQIVYTPMAPDFEELWDHPRFRGLLQRINLPG